MSGHQIIVIFFAVYFPITNLPEYFKNRNAEILIKDTKHHSGPVIGLQNKSVVPQTNKTSQVTCKSHLQRKLVAYCKWLVIHFADKLNTEPSQHGNPNMLDYYKSMIIKLLIVHS